MPEQQVYAGYDPAQPHVRFALDLTVNGEEFHLRERFPQGVWDTMSQGQRAEVVVAIMNGAAREIVARFADRIEVTPDA